MKLNRPLADDEVFVFGANMSGFHGAGSAGFAMFGTYENKWREFGLDKMPDGTKGLYAVKGRTGPQVGREGKSYGLPTIIRPGAKRSLIPDFTPLYECCRRNPSWTFLLAAHGGGLSGWTVAEFDQFMADAGPRPENLIDI